MTKFLSMRTSSWLKRNKTERSTTSYHDALTVGVIFCIDEVNSLPKIDSFIEKLENDNKMVTVLAYYPNKLEQYKHQYDCFTPRNISFWGGFNTSKVDRFVKQPFDYLFHLDEKPSKIIQGILAQSNAKCRVGKYDSSNGYYYEFMINTEDKDYLQQMYDYTSILN